MLENKHLGKISILVGATQSRDWAGPPMVPAQSTPRLVPEMAGKGDGTVIVPWYATGFRSEGFELALNEVAAVALRYGASSYAVYRQRDDRYRFQQLAHFERYSDWERYWEDPRDDRLPRAPLQLVPGPGALRLVGISPPPGPSSEETAVGHPRRPPPRRIRHTATRRSARALDVHARSSRSHRQPLSRSRLPVRCGWLTVA